MEKKNINFKKYQIHREKIYQYEIELLLQEKKKYQYRQQQKILENFQENSNYKSIKQIFFFNKQKEDINTTKKRYSSQIYRKMKDVNMINRYSYQFAC